MRQKGFVILPIIIVIAIIGVIFVVIKQNKNTNKENQSLNNLEVSPTETLSPTLNPTKDLQSPTLSPTGIPTARSFVTEETMMRKTLAGFEMYVGSRNTAGALTFFTPPKSELARKKYEEIRIKNLPYGLTSWSFVQGNDGLLIAEEIENGYKVQMTECRTNSGSCPTLILEMIRNTDAENGFLIDRYYGTEYLYQNNLGEEIKYHGFKF